LVSGKTAAAGRIVNVNGKKVNNIQHDFKQNTPGICADGFLVVVLLHLNPSQTGRQPDQVGAPTGI